MDRHLLLELLGYAASALIALSLMMSSIVRLRLINLVGAAAFALYGLLIGAYPVAILNALTVAVNALYLLRMLRGRQYFKLLPLRPESVCLTYFLEFYREDIRRLLPNFEYRPKPGQLLLFILQDCNPVGVLIADQTSDGVLRVELDFVIPRYHDLKIVRFLFVEHANFFRERGIREIVITSRTPEFGSYLRTLGFQAAEDGQKTFRLHYGELKHLQIR